MLACAQLEKGLSEMAEIDFANQLFDAVEDSAEPANARELISPQIAVKVYTRHKRNCPKRSRSDWARCNCVKWLYVHRDGKDRRFSAQTRSWEKAERPAREIRDSFDPTP